MNAIGKALFALESVAHLQGREAELLPLVDEARMSMDKLQDLLLLSALHDTVNPRGQVAEMLQDALKEVQP